MEIPIPQSGHWQKVQYGKAVIKPTLSEEYTGKSEVTLSIKKGVGNKNDVSPLVVLQMEIERDFKSYLTVSDRLNNPDRLIIEAKEKLKNQTPSIYGHDLGLIHSYGTELRMAISPVNMMRALRFMDAFIKLLRARGHELIVESGTFIIIDGLKLEIAIREKMKREMVTNKTNNYQNAEYSPSGILCFKYWEVSYHTFELKDGKMPLEKQLSKILAGLEIKVQELKAERIRIEKYWEEMSRKEQIQKDIKKRKEDEMSAFKELLNNSNRWYQSVTLRNYINELEKNAVVGNNLSYELQQKLEWARKKANWYDPMIETEDELLREYNRDTLKEDNRN